MTPAQLILRRVEARLVERLDALEPQLRSGDGVTWEAYCRAAATLAVIVPGTAQAPRGLLTTGELAATLGVSPKTLLRKRRRGELEAVQLGQRGRAALRWPQPIGVGAIR